MWFVLVFVAGIVAAVGAIYAFIIAESLGF